MPAETDDWLKGQVFIRLEGYGAFTGEKELIYYDGPLGFYVRDEHNRRWVVFAVDEDRDRREESWIMAVLSDERAASLEAKVLDLRDLWLHPDGDVLAVTTPYAAPWGDSGPAFMPIKMDPSEVPEEWLQDPGVKLFL